MKKILYSLSAFAFLIYFFGLSTGCKEDHSRQLIMLDSLDLMLTESKAYIDIDKVTIDARSKEISANYSMIRRFYTDTVSEELGNHLQQYKGILKVYKVFLTHIDEMQSEQKELTTQVRKLRNSTRNGNITKSEFRTYYDTEKADIEKLHALATRVGKTVLEVEPQYQRLSQEVNELVEKLTAKNLEAKTWIGELH